eukprot:2033201-Rhodomonas_salina.4
MMYVLLPGKHNFELLRRLVLPDGSILRAQLPGFIASYAPDTPSICTGFLYDATLSPVFLRRVRC